MILGIRPEYIKSSAEAAGKNNHRHQVGIDAIEQMGNEILVHSTIGGNQLIARFSPQADVAAGSVADIFFNLDRLHFFDDESGEII